MEIQKHIFDTDDTEIHILIRKGIFRQTTTAAVLVLLSRISLRFQLALPLSTYVTTLQIIPPSLFPRPDVNLPTRPQSAHWQQRLREEPLVEVNLPIFAVRNWTTSGHQSLLKANSRNHLLLIFVIYS